MHEAKRLGEVLQHLRSPYYPPEVPLWLRVAQPMSHGTGPMPHDLQTIYPPPIAIGAEIPTYLSKIVSMFV